MTLDCAVSCALQDLEKIESLADIMANIKPDAEMMVNSFANSAGVILDITLEIEKELKESYDEYIRKQNRENS